MPGWACLSPCASACDEALSKPSSCPCLHPPQASLASLGWPWPCPCSPRAGLVCYLWCWQKQNVLKALVCSLNWCRIGRHHFPSHMQFPNAVHLTLASAPDASVKCSSPRSSPTELNFSAKLFCTELNFPHLKMGNC